MLTTLSKIVLRGGLECYGKILVPEGPSILSISPLVMALESINSTIRLRKTLLAVGTHITMANVIQRVPRKSLPARLQTA